MVDTSGDRSTFFPAIENKHGGPISSWLERLAELGDAKYPEQIAYLRENHAFSQAHANALVMYFRGSTTSKRFATPDDYFDALEPTVARTAKAIFDAITATHPDLELVIAWNQPMLRRGDQYAIGMSASTKHILLNPCSADVLLQFADELRDYDVLKRTFKVPIDWEIDVSLLSRLVDTRLAELS